MIFRPLTTWPGARTSARKVPPFRAHYANTLQLLDQELFKLRASAIVLEADCSEDDIRLDGQLRADARLRSPGVILNFKSLHGPLRYPCDTFTEWQANLRAIALTLEHLRAVERFGVSKRGEQFVGWKKLPAADPGEMTPEQAADWLVTTGGGDTAMIITSRAAFTEAYRRACMNTHPDRHPEMVEDFKRVQAAKRALDQLFAGRGAP